MKKHFFRLMLIVGMFTQTACYHQSSLPQYEPFPTVVPVLVLAQYQHCEFLTSGISVVKQPSQWQGRELLPSHWFQQYRLYAISFGQQRSLGYSIEVDKQATLQGDTILVDAWLNSPSPDSMKAQIMTHPCVLIGMGMTDYQVVLLNP
jgi:hypothetical protein